MTGHNAPANLAVKPLIENAAEQVASDRAARSVTVAMLRLGVTVTVTGRGTSGVTATAVGLGTDARRLRLARWRRCRSALVGSAALGRNSVMLSIANPRLGLRTRTAIALHGACACLSSCTVGDMLMTA
jgi:hypothetical protein